MPFHLSTVLSAECCTCADAVPLRKIPLNKVPYVPSDEPLLGILDRFQEGRSHMAIVSRLSATKAASIKKAVKSGLTQRLRQRVGLDTSSESSDEDETETTEEVNKEDMEDWERDMQELTDMKIEKGADVVDVDSNGDSAPRHGHHSPDGATARGRRPSRRGSARQGDLEMGIIDEKDKAAKEKPKRTPPSHLEQSMPADAALSKAGANEVCIQLLEAFMDTEMYCVVVPSKFRPRYPAIGYHHPGRRTRRYVAD
jgi:metal transporter CNNM